MKYTDFVHEIEKDAEYFQAKEDLKLHFALGNAILKVRIKKGWSQAELAEKVGTKQANISRIESGLANPTLQLIQKILKALDLEMFFASGYSSTSVKTVNFGEYPIPAPEVFVKKLPATITEAKYCER